MHEERENNIGECMYIYVVQYKQVNLIITYKYRKLQGSQGSLSLYRLQLMAKVQI